MVKYISTLPDNHLEVVTASQPHFLINSDVASQQSKTIKKEKKPLYVQPCGVEPTEKSEDTLST